MHSIYEQFLEVPLHLIDIDPEANTRIVTGLDAATLQKLGERMQLAGQATPVTLRTSNADRFDLIAGMRRYLAAQHMGWKTIWGGILLDDLSDSQVALVHRIENHDRSQLSSYETAKAAADYISEFRSNTLEYSQLTGLKKQTLTQYLFWLNNLPDNILEAWKNCHHLLNHKALAHLASFPPHEASRIWENWKSESETGLSKDKLDDLARRPKRPNPFRRPMTKQLLKLHENASSSTMDNSTKKIVLQTIEYAQGARRYPPKFPQQKKKG